MPEAALLHQRHVLMLGTLQSARNDPEVKDLADRHPLLTHDSRRQSRLQYSSANAHRLHLATQASAQCADSQRCTSQ
jgi:hypothetical protein